jgi:hypothetical protein
MSRGSVIILSLILAAGLLCSTGCTTLQEPAGVLNDTPYDIPESLTPPTGTPGVVTEMPPGFPGPVVSPLLPTQNETQGPATPTRIPRLYGKDAMDNPRIELFAVKKESMTFDIPDCGMRAAFPQAAGDPGYGIRQPVPKLLLLDEEEIENFFATYEDTVTRYPDNERYVDPLAIGGPACSGVVATPFWNFVRINATFIPRNARPGEYDIGFDIISHGVEIEQLRMNRSFVLDDPIILVLYIPLRVDEMDAFDSIRPVFARRE